MFYARVSKRAEREHHHGVRIANPTYGRRGFRRQRKKGYIYLHCHAEGMGRSQEASLSVGGRAQPLFSLPIWASSATRDEWAELSPCLNFYF